VTRPADARLVVLEHAARARQRAQLAAMTDEELAAERAKLAPEVLRWLGGLSDAELLEIQDDTPAGRALLVTAPPGGLT